MDHFTIKNADKLIEILRLLAQVECQPWMREVEADGIGLIINCNDLFYWACADSERVTENDIDLIKETIQEIRAACPSDVKSYHATILHFESLFCCKKRKMRPQNCILVKEPEWARKLYEKCGPERTDKECG